MVYNCLYLQVLKGNTNWVDVVKNSIPVIYARYIRLYPVSWYIRGCIRMELYGKPWSEGDILKRFALCRFPKLTVFDVELDENHTCDTVKAQRKPSRSFIIFPTDFGLLWFHSFRVMAQSSLGMTYLSKDSISYIAYFLSYRLGFRTDRG